MYSNAIDASKDNFLNDKEFRIDALIPYVLEFAPGTDLHDNSLVVEGKLILQDKVFFMK